MTAISFTPARIDRAAHATQAHSTRAHSTQEHSTQAHLTHLRLTVRGRRVLATVVALPVAVAIAFAAVSGGSALASRDAGAPVGTFEEVTVMAGDSLWGIAQEVAPSADPRDVVDAIVRLNALDDVELSAGQRLAIPAEYSAAS